MRIIGYIANKASAATFSDFLYVQGIANKLEQEKEGWAVWIHSEDELEKSKSLLSSFLANPTDPQYHQQARQAEELREREAEEEEQAAKKYFDRSRTFRTTLPFGLGPLTTFLIVASIVVTVLDSYGVGRAWLQGLRFSYYPTGAPEILDGQVWRLITPIFMHASLLMPFGFTHLLFNVLCLASLASVLELRRGTKWLIVFTLAVAALSNLGQYLWSGPAFCGMSGVVYGLLGYVWIKGQCDPNSDIALPSQTVTMMLVWYFLCLFDLIPGMKAANVVHTVALVTGMIWGYLSSLSARQS